MALQQLLDASYERAGAHLLRIHTPERRATGDIRRAPDRHVLLVLATVTADCRPIAGPVDGIFYQGAFHSGWSPDSVRFRHIRARPQVSATHVPGEDFAVTVHGRAVPIERPLACRAALRRTLLDIYTPRYGEDWESFLASGPRTRVSRRRGCWRLPPTWPEPPGVSKLVA